MADMDETRRELFGVKPPRSPRAYAAQADGAARATAKILDVARAGSELPEVVPTDARYAQYQAAKVTFERALMRTRDYLRRVSAKPKAHDEAEEIALSRLWSDASGAIDAFDPKLAVQCFIKAQGWSDPAVWADPKLTRFGVHLSDMIEGYAEMMDREGKERHLMKSAPAKILPFAVISLVSFLLGVAILIFMVLNGERLVALGLAGRLYYIVLLPLALAVAGFLFGVLQSYAHYRGQQFGGTLTLGGPIVGFFLVVCLGFFLVKDPGDFPLTVYVHGAAGPRDVVLSSEGDVFVDLRGDRRQTPIQAQGQAYFPAIPASFRGQTVDIWVRSTNFESVGARRIKLGSPSEYLEVRRRSGRVRGQILSDQPACIAKATVFVADFPAKVDAASGWFEVVIPGDRMSDDLVLSAKAPGCVSQSFAVTPNSNRVDVNLAEAASR